MKDQTPDNSTRTKSKYPAASFDNGMLYLCVQRHTDLYQSTTLFEPSMYSLTHTITKAHASHGLGIRKLLARTGTLFLSNTMLLCQQEKQQYSALCQELGGQAGFTFSV